MIESGAMLISGRRCGQILLALGSRKTNNWGAVPTKTDVTFEDVLFDVALKLDDLKASRSPVEAEIDFVSQWLAETLASQSVGETEQPSPETPVEAKAEAEVEPEKSNVLEMPSGEKM